MIGEIGWRVADIGGGKHNECNVKIVYPGAMMVARSEERLRKTKIRVAWVDMAGKEFLY